ncbi:hypothetical protein IWQ57_005473, partial [Coemansia nantahalensis]
MLLGGTDQSRRNTAPTVSLRPRRTSYDGASGGSSSDSESNPYARKRFRSVRSAVAHAYPRRLSRRQLAGDGRSNGGDESDGSGSADSSSGHGGQSSNSAPGLYTHSAPRARRSASHGNTHPGTPGPSSSPVRRPGSAGKWRPASDDEPPHSPAAGRCRREPPASASMLLPSGPQTTPRASASPDQTPFPPSTSPTFVSFDPSGLHNPDSAELQAA